MRIRNSILVLTVVLAVSAGGAQPGACKLWVDAPLMPTPVDSRRFIQVTDKDDTQSFGGMDNWSLMVTSSTPYEVMDHGHLSLLQKPTLFTQHGIRTTQT